MTRRALNLLLLCLLAGAGLAAQTPSKFSRPPDLANVSYGPHERNVLDLWKAPSQRPTPLVIFIHGGGFRGGDKNNLNPGLLDLCLGAGMSVAAINYRLSQHASYPAPMHDGARAVQFLRSRAREWNLDPKAFGATGGSAGAGISLWIGFHNDLAEPSSQDPVRRQSTRLSAMAVNGAQTSYDPRLIARLIGEAAAKHPALEPFYGLKGPELATERAYRIFEDASPITHLTAGDPPAFLFYVEPNADLPPDAKPGQGIHHPRFGALLKERMDKLGIPCIVRHRDEYGGEALGRLNQEMLEFFQKHLRPS